VSWQEPDPAVSWQDRLLNIADGAVTVFGLLLMVGVIVLFAHLSVIAFQTGTVPGVLVAGTFVAFLGVVAYTELRRYDNR
jgi:membrane-bound ClpP family serine protease